MIQFLDFGLTGLKAQLRVNISAAGCQSPSPNKQIWIHEEGEWVIALLTSCRIRSSSQIKRTKETVIFKRQSCSMDYPWRIFRVNTSAIAANRPNLNSWNKTNGGIALLTCSRRILSSYLHVVFNNPDKSRGELVCGGLQMPTCSNFCKSNVSHSIAIANRPVLESLSAFSIAPKV